MFKAALRPIVPLALMIVLLVIALTSGDVVYSKLSASFAIILGAVTYRYLPARNMTPGKTNPKIKAHFKPVLGRQRQAADLN